MDAPLHSLQPLERFTVRADDYARYRPSYPATAIEAILAGVAAPVLAVDIGAGTGISTRLLAACGVQVIGIEPNPAMRDMATAFPGTEYRGGTAEQTGLEDRSIDLVTCFQAFHWFRAIESLEEFARILKPGGRLAVVWNNRDESDGFTAGYGEVIRVASGDHPATRHQGCETLLPLLESSARFRTSRIAVFVGSQSLDFAGLVGRVRSSSYIPLDGETQDRLLEKLRVLYNRWTGADGLVHLRYLTRVLLAERAEDS